MFESTVPSNPSSTSLKRIRTEFEKSAFKDSESVRKWLDGHLKGQIRTLLDFKARMLDMMIQKFGYLQKDLAKKLGKSEGWVSHHLAMIRPESILYPGKVCKIDSGNLTERQARAASGATPEELDQILDEANQTGQFPSARKIEEIRKPQENPKASIPFRPIEALAPYVDILVVGVKASGDSRVYGELGGNYSRVLEAAEHFKGQGVWTVIADLLVKTVDNPESVSTFCRELAKRLGHNQRLLFEVAVDLKAGPVLPFEERIKPYAWALDAAYQAGLFDVFFIDCIPTRFVRKEEVAS